ncbi:hypothetical protein SCHPADRAFT_903258 [Schizopora paradoxa]|uniref:Uncharacterized protein n=1 Tax=Schizopora paradoxa TaxID=27342 RepID=A0A0H2RSA1_9AGAM|nr:hypothetical protein SCHPADRAFT_903258 [Schizopora paradoxa]
MFFFAQSGLSLGSGILLATILATSNVLATASPKAAPAPYYAPDYNARFIPHHAAPVVHHNKFVKRLDSPQAQASPSTKLSYTPRAYTSVHRSALRRALSSYHKHIHNRDVVSDFESLLNGFSNGRSDAQDNERALKALAEQSGVASSDDDGFQQNAATQATGLHSIMSKVDNLLKQMGGNDNGLANYDNNSKLETLIKDLINANKNALTSLNLMIYNIPTLGPVLGPIVYDIKCIIEDILDLTENLTDGLLNALGPGFTGLLGQANAINCASGMKALGLCI